MQRLVNTKKILLESLTGRFFLFSLLVWGLPFFFSGCGLNRQVYEKETLFELEIGKMEKQLDLMLAPDPTRFVRDNYVNLNGLFYIANSRINKVMVFTSYGDLLSLYYDPLENPRPVTLTSSEESGVVSNLNAYPHEFENIGLVTVDSRKMLMVDEQVDRGRAEVDRESGIPLDRVIRRFNAYGEAVDYLGQEGVGGTPFPYIHSLHISKGDRFTVVCRNLGSWEVYSYEPSGQLIQSLEFDEERLPSATKERTAALENIYVDHDNSRLYLKINFYEKRFGKDDGPMGVTHFKETSVWVYDLTQRRFTLHFDLPKKEVQDEFSRQNREILYDLIGIDRNGNLFFIAPHDNQFYEILILSRQGRVIKRIRLGVDETEIYFNQFYVSPEGIVSGLFTYSDKVELAWWRTDSIVRRRRD